MKLDKMFLFNKSWMLLTVLLLFALQYWPFDNVLLWYVLVLSLLWTALLALGTYDHKYWSNKGVFAPRGLPFVGHIWSVITFKEQTGEFYKRIYDAYKKERLLGIHQLYVRTLVVCDPELIKRICVNDFQHFTDRGFMCDKQIDPLANSVLYLRGNEWKGLRMKISPIFSPNKLRGMYPLIENTADEFVMKIRNIFKNETSNDERTVNDSLIKKAGANDVTVNAEKLIGGYTADAIIPCAFGVKSFVMDNPNDPFAVALHAFYEMSPYNLLSRGMYNFWPKLAVFLRLRIIPKKTHDFFYNIVTSVLRAREKESQEKRGDLIDIMMALQCEDCNNNKTASSDDVQITDMIISSNAFIVLLGGFETSSATLSFLLLELAAHPRIQEKMRREILDALKKNDGRISYDALQELTYMEMVINETLRLYPPFPMIQRQCTKDYTIPGSQLLVEKGTIVVFPTLGIHRDEQYFENASQFVPERWASCAPPPGVYMPFGDGPRYCIGKRFALIQIKCCLVRLLSHFKFSPASRTSKLGNMLVEPRAEPFAVDPRMPLALHPADSKIRISLL